LLALMKHPMVQLKITDQSVKYLIRLLELQSLRGSRPSPGLKALRSKLSKDKDKDLITFLETLEDLAQPFTSALSKGAQLFELLTAHLKLAEALCAPEDHDDHPLWRGDDGNALNAFFSELLQTAETTGQGLGAITSASYPTLLEKLMQKQTVRPNFGTHPRLAIWGTIEGRLQQADVLVLGGLNENTWPKESDPGPWMSRAMRRDFGLPPVERKIGLSAHDFSQVFNASQVFLTRSQKVGGAPAISSRWLMRINCLLDAAGIGRDFLAKNKTPWRDWLEVLNKGTAIEAIVQRPAPRPPAMKRLRDITVTEVETWVKNPYAIYAKKLLRLRQLDPLDADPGAAEKGTLIHEALEIFVKRYPKQLPPNAKQVLQDIGQEVFDEWLDRPGIWAFWWPRFLRIVDWFIDQEEVLRAVTTLSTVEERGRLTLPSVIGDFELRGIADRINLLNDGSLSVIDYKTGTVPSRKDVQSGLAPQLPLEAAMLAEGKFQKIPNGQVSELAYWSLKGGIPAGKIEVRGEGDNVADLADQAMANLKQLIDHYSVEATAFTAVAPEEGGPRYDPYVHLARAKEWYGIGSEADGGE
jgi:ATP-dependent helicase/nuclease subunit B